MRVFSREGRKLGFIVILVAGIAGFFLVLGSYNRRIRSEYVTAGVISDVKQFVTKNGRWPRNWEELPQNYSEYTRLNFKANISLMATNKQALSQAILPLYDRYIQYPHAERQLDYLQVILLAVRPTQGSSER